MRRSGFNHFKAQYPIEGGLYSGASAWRAAISRGLTISHFAFIQRLKKGINTWDELLKPVLQANSAGGKESMRKKRANSAKEKEEMAALMKELDRRKALLK